jgi:hypothetical protein
MVAFACSFEKPTGNSKDSLDSRDDRNNALMENVLSHPTMVRKHSRLTDYDSRQNDRNDPPHALHCKFNGFLDYR